MTRRFSVGVHIFFFAIAASILSFSVNEVFLDEIGHAAGKFQKSFIIDGYFYSYLGQRVWDEASASAHSLLGTVVEVSPNQSSIGVVVLSTILTAIIPIASAQPVFFIASYSMLLLALSKKYDIKRSFYLLFFCGLLPYLFIPTKEAFLIIGVLLGLVAYKSCGISKTVGFLLSCLIIILSRPEAFLIFFVSISCYLLFFEKKSWLNILLGVLVFGIAYLAFMRTYLIDISLAFQGLAQAAETDFCKLGPLTTCLSGNSLPEFVFLQRTISVIVLPGKWLLDVMELFSPEEFAKTAWVLRISLGAQVMVIGIVFLSFFLRLGKLSAPQKILIIFSIIYGGLYITLFYFQPTRHIAFALSLVFLSLIIREKNHETQRNQ